MLMSLPRPAKITFIILGILIVLALLVVIAINIYMRATFASFYRQAKEEFAIPGTQEGFVVQDLDYCEPAKSWLFSGYEGPSEGSPIYKRDASGGVTHFFVTLPDGSTYDGHGGGISSTDQFVYLTCEGGYLVLSAEAVANAQQGDRVPVLFQQPLDFSPAFLNIQDGMMYTGDFYYPGPYDTAQKEHIATPDGTENCAVMYVFEADDSAPFGFSDQPRAVYSIPAKVQGVCFSPAGNMVLSTSWGIGASHFLTYDAPALAQDGTFAVNGKDVPLYCLDGRTQLDDLELPPMSEGIVSYDDRILFVDEAASHKYIFGKLYGFDKVYSVPFAE